MAAATAHTYLDPDRREQDHEDERSSIAASQASTIDTFASSSNGQMPAQHYDTAATSQTSLVPDHGAYDVAMETDEPKRLAPKTQGNGENVKNGHGSNGPVHRDIEGVQTEYSSARMNGHDLAQINTIVPVDSMPHGQKRTASGQVKTPTTTSTTTARDVGKGHKRAASTNTQVIELSAQLRARLSYAMIKVQNGWESRTISEVETLASQHGSPKSLPSPWRTSASPPKPSSSGFGRPPLSAATAQASHALNGSLQADTAFPARPPYSGPSHNPTSSVPSLAPPVDFGVRSNRRTTVSGRPPPYLANGAGRNHSNISASSASSNGSAPSAPLITATPPFHNTHLAPLQTPSQRATASERDAIETLLFMSSPGNSQTFRHASSQPLPQAQFQYSPPRSAVTATTPRQTHYSPHAAKQVNFMPRPLIDPSAMDAIDQVPLSPRKRGFLDGAQLQSEESIDRVLDQMPIDGDGDSSSDESLESVAAPPARSERPVVV